MPLIGINCIKPFGYSIFCSTYSAFAYYLILLHLLPATPFVFLAVFILIITIPLLIRYPYVIVFITL